MSGTGGSPGGQNRYGPFHRLRSPTQTDETAKLQLANGQVWGQQARWSSLLSVKAFRGPLPATEAGIEFVTDTAPSPGSHPNLVFWYESAPGVTVAPINGQNFAIISVRVTTYHYP